MVVNLSALENLKHLAVKVKVRLKEENFFFFFYNRVWADFNSRETEQRECLSEGQSKANKFDWLIQSA